MNKQKIRVVNHSWGRYKVLIADDATKFVSVADVCKLLGLELAVIPRYCQLNELHEFVGTAGNWLTPKTVMGICDQIEHCNSKLLRYSVWKLLKKDEQESVGEPLPPKNHTLECVQDIFNTRAKDGKVENSFTEMAEAWSAYLHSKGYKGVSLSSTDVALMMSLFKIIRCGKGVGGYDSYIDACGYMALAGEIYWSCSNK